MAKSKSKSKSNSNWIVYDEEDFLKALERNKKIREQIEANKMAIFNRLPNDDMRFLFKRFFELAQNPGHRFFYTNRGRLYEVAIKALMGHFNSSVKFLEEADIVDTLAHELGPDMSNKGADFQAKGPNATIKFISEKDIVWKNRQKMIIDKRATLPKVIETYIKKGNKGKPWRFALTFGMEYLDSYLDVGPQTMRDYVNAQNASMGPFSIERADVPYRNNVLKGVGASQVKNIFQQIELLYETLDFFENPKSAQEVAILKKLSEASGESISRKVAIGQINRVIKDLVGLTHVIRTRMDITHATDMVQNYGVIWRTSYQREDMADPVKNKMFWDMFENTFDGSTKQSYMTSIPGKTRGNKQPQNYYDFKYTNPNY